MRGKISKPAEKAARKKIKPKTPTNKKDEQGRQNYMMMQAAPLLEKNNTPSRKAVRTFCDLEKKYTDDNTNRPL